MEPVAQEGPAAHLTAAGKQRRKKKSRMGRLPSEIDSAELASWFHVPAEQAAQEMRVSLTVLKRVARKHGITRWPYRKVKSLTRAMSHPAASTPRSSHLGTVLADPQPSGSHLSGAAAASQGQQLRIEQQIVASAAAAAAAAAASQGSPRQQHQQQQLQQPLMGMDMSTSSQPYIQQLPGSRFGTTHMHGLAAHPGAPLALPPQQWQQAPQWPHQQQAAASEAFQHAWHLPEPAAAASTHSQGLWGGMGGPSSVGPLPAHIVQQGGPALVLRPQAQPWHAGQPLPLPDRAGQLAPLRIPTAAPPPAPAAPDAPADSAALTPTSADTRGIEVLLTAIEREQQWEDAAGPSPGTAAGAPGGAAQSEEVAAPPRPAASTEVQQAPAQAHGEEGAGLLSVGSEGGSAGSSTNPAIASASSPSLQPSVLQPLPVHAASPGTLSAGMSAAANTDAAAAPGAEADLLGRLSASLRSAAAVADQERRSASPAAGGFRPVAPARAPAGTKPPAHQASLGSVWQAAGAAAAAAAPPAPPALPSPFDAAAPAAPAQQLAGNSPFSAELSLTDLLARKASGALAATVAREAPRQAPAGAAGVSAGSKEGDGMERLPTLEWAGTGRSGSPRVAPSSARAGSLGAEFSFGLSGALAPNPSCAIERAASGLANAGSIELFGSGVRMEPSVGAKRPAAFPASGGSPTKRAATAGPPVAVEPALQHLLQQNSSVGSNELNLQSIMSLLRHAAGVQPVQEQQWEADRRQLLQLVLGGSARVASPSPPPRQEAVLEALLRSNSLQQQQQQAQQPSAVAQLQALLSGMRGSSGGASGGNYAGVLGQLAALKQRQQQQAAAQQQAQVAAAQRAASPTLQQMLARVQQAQQVQQQAQQQQQAQLVQAQAARSAAAPPAAATAGDAGKAAVPEQVALYYLQQYAQRMGFDIGNIALQNANQP